VIEAKEVFKSYGPKKVLRGIDLKVNEGETLTIIGGSGMGKSTFIKCAIGLVKPDSGSITIDGDEVVGADPFRLAGIRRKCGYLFQEAALFDSLPVWENVVFGLKYLTDIPQSKWRQIATDKLALVGLKGVEDLRPSELSGGMKKRVGLARAIAADPAYIFYDEPTTGLDPIMSDVISELILGLQKKLGVTSIVVTHDMTSAFKISNRIAMLFEGDFLVLETPDGIKQSKDERVQQFINGRSAGPIQMKLRHFD
jgi:phospholipid/cholesterol/gamma-HCH transport system ATP-binding protein